MSARREALDAWLARSGDVLDEYRNSTVPFAKAKVGDRTHIYSDPDGDLIVGEFTWVTDLDFFDERDGEVVLKRQTWLLVDEDELVLPDPFAYDDDEEPANGL